MPKIVSNSFQTDFILRNYLDLISATKRIFTIIILSEKSIYMEGQTHQKLVVNNI